MLLECSGEPLVPVALALLSFVPKSFVSDSFVCILSSSGVASDGGIVGPTSVDAFSPSESVMCFLVCLDFSPEMYCHCDNVLLLPVDGRTVSNKSSYWTWYCGETSLVQC